MISVTVFYISDLGNYSYLDQRIDVSSFKLLENPLIVLDMIWETYPLLQRADSSKFKPTRKSMAIEISSLYI